MEAENLFIWESPHKWIITTQIFFTLSLIFFILLIICLINLKKNSKFKNDEKKEKKFNLFLSGSILFLILFLIVSGFYLRVWLKNNKDFDYQLISHTNKKRTRLYNFLKGDGIKSEIGVGNFFYSSHKNPNKNPTINKF